MSTLSDASAQITTCTPSTSISICDDGLPFLSEPNPNSLLSSSAATGDFSLLALFHPRVNTANAQSGQLSNSIVGILIMGILGSFALHQSPEIEALTQQCERLKNDVLLLRLQVDI
ncbi:hypothetical protein PsorP6_004913 [Peronosclerospora sorghi]|uniref:Uncharacterized protein n=1 Tax=Peronosclerospora sorghi TaxID=230839 RepID=A0ACC0W517_9STRA|nr:hypothetical protein PsorP6_004913 [Peronosclerospora sorghi]